VTKTLDPKSRVVRGLKGEYYIVREVAAKTGISQSTLRRAIHNNTKELMPSKAVGPAGGQKVYLYTPDDIERIVAHYQAMRTPEDFDGVVQTRTGRPRRFTDDERAERARLHSKANYWKRRAANLERDGRKGEAIEARKTYDKIRKVLDA
jgi:predicted metal-dependent phosphoesterase TrpH